ncbi:hypothetical protein ACROYT_G037571 [Oculina patagonica]
MVQYLLVSEAAQNTIHSAMESDRVMKELKTSIRKDPKIAVDLFELDGKNFMVTVEYYSSYFEVDRLNTQTGKEVIGKLKIRLARHGIPDELVSDNGPPFSSTEFNAFASQYGFEHVTSSPGYPQSNGKVENSVKLEQAVVHPQEEAVMNPIENTPASALRNNAPTPPVEEQPVSKTTPAKETPKKPGQDDLPRESKPSSDTAVIKTRSGHVIKPPSRFKD